MYSNVFHLLSSGQKLPRSDQNATHAECSCSRPGTYALVIWRHFNDILVKEPGEPVTWAVMGANGTHAVLILMALALGALAVVAWRKDRLYPVTW